MKYYKNEVKTTLKDYLLCSNDFIKYLNKPEIDLIEKLRQAYETGEEKPYCRK